MVPDADCGGEQPSASARPTAMEGGSRAGRLRELPGGFLLLGACFWLRCPGSSLSRPLSADGQNLSPTAALRADYRQQGGDRANEPPHASAGPDSGRLGAVALLHGAAERHPRLALPRSTPAVLAAIASNVLIARELCPARRSTGDPGRPRSGIREQRPVAGRTGACPPQPAGHIHVHVGPEPMKPPRTS